MTAPTPADTYAVLAARQRQQAIDAAKHDIARLALRTLATDAAHHAQTQGGQAGIASGLAAIAYAILARTENP